MHIELLVEDQSGSRLLELLLPKIVGPVGQPHTWRIHAYKGIGRLPKGLQAKGDPNRRILLDRLPQLLRGYGRTPGIEAVIVVLDADNRDCKAFLSELTNLASTIGSKPLFRLAIEELEAWYLGDREALRLAYPRAKKAPLDAYRQDAVCGTWELLADCLYPGGSAAIKKAGWPLPGQIKHQWAESIGAVMEPERNVSPSFRKFYEGLHRLVTSESKG